MHLADLPGPIPDQSRFQISLMLLMAYMGIADILVQLLSPMPVIEIPQLYSFLSTSGTRANRSSLVVVVPVAPPSTDADGLLAKGD